MLRCELDCRAVRRRLHTPEQVVAVMQPRRIVRRLGGMDRRHARPGFGEMLDQALDTLGSEIGLLVSELAGKSNILWKAREFGIDLDRDTPDSRRILDRLKALEDEGFQFEGAEASFELLMERALGRHTPYFELEAYRVIVEEQSAAEEPVAEALYRLGELASQGLPAGGEGLAWLALPGVVWLLRQAGTRPAGAALVLSFVGLLVAAALGWYPMGVGYEGRVALFANPLVLLLAGIGVGGLVIGAHLRHAVWGASAVAAVVFAVARPVHVSYYDHDHSAMVEDLARRVHPADGVVLNSRASYLVGVYAGWPSAIRRDDSPEQFHLVFDRHGTLTLAPRAEEAAERLTDLPGWLATFGYRRVFVFSIRRETKALEDLMRDAGFRAAAERRSTTGAVLVEYRRIG